MNWRYSQKLASRIENPKFAGFFIAQERRGMRLVAGREKDIALYFLIDESDGVIADAKFQTRGVSALIGAAEAACELLIRKNHDQARRVTAELIDKQMRGSGDKEAFPPESAFALNRVLSAIDQAVEQCSDIPFAETYVAPPMELDLESTGGYPGWSELSKEKQIVVVEQVIASEIRPYIELDAGGVQIIDLVDGKELTIAYEGSCTSCHSATGATLSAIEQILQAKVCAEMKVIPDLSFLKEH